MQRKKTGKLFNFCLQSTVIIAKKRPKPIDKILTSRVMSVAIRNSSPHPASPNTSLSNLNI